MIEIDMKEFAMWQHQVDMFRTGYVNGHKVADILEAEALRKARPILKKHMQRHMPANTGQARKDIGSQVVVRKNRQPLLAVGANMRPGKKSYRLHFVNRGTKERYTKGKGLRGFMGFGSKPGYRGRIAPHRISERTLASGGEAAYVAFMREWINQFAKVVVTKRWGRKPTATYVR